MQADEVAHPFHREGWVYEEKYDGWRMVDYKDGTAVRLLSRAGKDHRRRFAELVAAWPAEVRDYAVRLAFADHEPDAT